MSHSMSDVIENSSDAFTDVPYLTKNAMTLYSVYDSEAAAGIAAASKTHNPGVFDGRMSDSALPEAMKTAERRRAINAETTAETVRTTASYMKFIDTDISASSSYPATAFKIRSAV